VESAPVYVGPMPRMARDIAIRVLSELGSAVLDAPTDPAQLRQPAPGEPAPVLIASARGRWLDDYEQRLLAAVPQAVVIVFDEDARRLARHELWPRRVALGELSPDAIAEAIRTATSWDERFRA
jgi:hypothetical protein